MLPSWLAGLSSRSSYRRGALQPRIVEVHAKPDLISDPEWTLGFYVSIDSVYKFHQNIDVSQDPFDYRYVTDHETLDRFIDSEFDPSEYSSLRTKNFRFDFDSFRAESEQQNPETDDMRIEPAGNMGGWLVKCQNVGFLFSTKFELKMIKMFGNRTVNITNVSNVFGHLFLQNFHGPSTCRDFQILLDHPTIKDILHNFNI
jgi:hypothetical protein